MSNIVTPSLSQILVAIQCCMAGSRLYLSALGICRPYRQNALGYGPNPTMQHCMATKICKSDFLNMFNMHGNLFCHWTMLPRLHQKPSMLLKALKKPLPVGFARTLANVQPNTPRQVPPSKVKATPISHDAANLTIRVSHKKSPD